MTDMQSSPDSSPATGPQQSPAVATREPVPPTIYPSAGNQRSRHIRLLYLLFLILLGVGAWQAWTLRSQIHDLRGEVAQRLRDGETVSNGTRMIAKALQDSEKDLRAKVSVLESKQTEAQSQQLALEQLYQDLSKNRDDWALAEIEQVLSTASQQLQLAGNVQGAVIALQNADKNLSRSDKPQFITIRRAIAKDLDMLKGLPSLDTTGIALRLDSVIGQIDSMPLLADEKPVAAPTPPKRPPRGSQNAAAASAKAATTDKNPAPTDWVAVIDAKWQSFSTEMWDELKQLIRVRDVSHPDALLLSPTQAYYARENLKLRLLNARLALLSRNEPAFRSDMIAAQDTIARYFDTRAKQTQTVQALLRQVQNSNLSIQMPTLAESLNAVRNYKGKP
jgi:uroporphyrin-3 C-methyltransferase/uroporphyrinogen III methyltransferase/synthase